MFCNQCGKEIPNGVKFCPTCGASVASPEAQTQQTAQSTTGETVGTGANTAGTANGMYTGAAGNSNVTGGMAQAGVKPQIGSLTLPGTSAKVQWILSCVVGGMQFLSAAIFWWVGLFAVSASVSMFGISQSESQSVSLHDLFEWKFFSVFFMILVLLSAIWMILRVVDDQLALSFLKPVRTLLHLLTPMISLATGILTLIVFLFQWITGASQISDVMDLMLSESGLGSLGSSLAGISFHVTFWGVLFLLFTLATIVISAYLLVCELSRKKTIPQTL